jgi:hypothetical protein
MFAIVHDWMLLDHRFLCLLKSCASILLLYSLTTAGTEGLLAFSLGCTRTMPIGLVTLKLDERHSLPPRRLYGSRG